MRRSLRVQADIKPSKYNKPKQTNPKLIISAKWLKALGVEPGQYILIELEDDILTGARLVITSEQ